MPETPASIIAQDMTHAIGSIGGGPAAPPLDAAIVRQTHDFFAQPVRGARAYFLRRVLHDWPDSCCLRILKELLAKAGFEVVQFWQKYPDSEGIIEAMISPL